VSWAELDDGDVGRSLRRASASACISGKSDPQGYGVARRDGLRHENASLVVAVSLQEIITMTVFAGYAVLWADEALRWNYAAAAVCLAAEAVFILRY
jgi:hypothetical protein